MDLKGLRIGIGPVGSGTEEMMGRVLVLLAGLDLVISRQPIDQQLDMLERGELDLAAMIISDEAKLLADAVTRRKLDILQLPDLESLARHIRCHCPPGSSSGSRFPCCSAAWRCGIAFIYGESMRTA